MMSKNIIPYNPELVPLARRLRNNSTLSEILLWQKLKKRKLLGYDFDPQKSIAEYIVDFFCHELMLAIEVDGNSHDHKYEEDLSRQQKIEQFEITVIRFEDVRIKKDMDEVLRELRWKIKELES